VTGRRPSPGHAGIGTASNAVGCWERRTLTGVTACQCSMTVDTVRAVRRGTDEICVYRLRKSCGHSASGAI
jgi:hypothetical protein